MKYIKNKGSLIVCFLIFLFILNTNMVFSTTCKTFEKAQTTQNKGNIMLTGYWNPTGQMIKSFSTDGYLNPDGWQGKNWEDLGYDIYSFFPNPGSYNGTFEVDYQNTWNDFWNITSEINPIAIISFGGGNGPWEIEYNARNLDYWINDDNAPYQPTPSPPDDSVEVGYIRHPTIPIEKIESSVNEETDIEAWIDWDGTPGKYLCEYIAYLGMWYQDIHQSYDDEHCCMAAGFIHVNANVPLIEAERATEITLRETISYLDSLNQPPGKPSLDGTDTGKAGSSYDYLISSIDPNGDSIYYFIDWGDDTVEEWIGAYDSGFFLTKTHTWNEENTYSIRVKAKDEHDSESEWATLEVSMPINKEINLHDYLINRLINQFPILQNLL